MTKWFKNESINGVYYSLTGATKNLTYHFSNPEDLTNFVNKLDIGFDIRAGNFVEVYDKELPSGESEDIPNGVYAHEYGEPGTPERLVPMKNRDDNYMDLLESLSELDENIDFFIKSKELYDQTSTMYKMGVLLFGQPGTGKSSFIRHFVKNKEAIVIYLKGIPYNSFLRRLEEATKDRLKIFVMEECVANFANDSQIREMLEFLDGSQTVSNAIYFLTTNHAGLIPENVIRNGRIDSFVKVDFPNEVARHKIIKRYLGRDASDAEITITDRLPIVDIRQLCFLHKKTGESFEKCVKIIKEKNEMIKKHFGKTKDISLI